MLSMWLREANSGMKRGILHHPAAVGGFVVVVVRVFSGISCQWLDYVCVL